MKILKTLAAPAAIIMLVISCAADSEKLRKAFKKTSRNYLPVHNKAALQKFREGADF